MTKTKTDEACIWILDDGRYWLRVTAQSQTTSKIKEGTRTMRAGATIEDARQMRQQIRERLRAELKAEAATNAAQKSAAAITTVADLAEWWLKRKARRLKASTVATYRTVLTDKVLPELGHIPLERLTRRDLSSWIEWAESTRKKDGKLYARDTVSKWWRTLRTMLRHAHAHGYLNEDPSRRLEKPDTGVGGRQEQRVLTLDQLGEFVDAVRTYQPARYHEVLVLAYTGMRAGELYGLEWRDIDLGERIIHIQRAVWRGHVDSTKTHAPRRAPIPSFVAEALAEWREQQMKAQPPGFAKGIVFPSRDGKRRYVSSIRKPMRIVGEHMDHGIRVTPQVLRRTWNTALVEGGVDRIVLRSILGHSDEAMTERYSHVSEDLQRRALASVLGE